MMAGQSQSAALVCGNRSRSYGELSERIRRKSRELRLNRNRPGRLAIELPDSFELIEWAMAAWEAGWCVLIVDSRLTEADRRSRTSRFCPHVVVRGLEGSFGVGAFRTDVEHSVEWQSREPGPESAGRRAVPDPTHEALVLFSSGSTGIPKMIARSRESLREELVRYAEEEDAPGPGSRTLCLVPLSHSFGLISAAAHTLERGGTLFFPEMQKPRTIADCIERHEITHVYGVGFHYRLLADEWSKRLNAAGKPEAPAPLRLLSSGGPLPQQLRERMDKLGMRIGQQYGMSEVGYIAVNWPGVPAGSVGRPAEHLRTSVSASGELVIELDRSPYLEPNDQWIGTAGGRNGRGRLRTQDIVSTDDRGRLYILRRSNDQVSIGGLKVRLSEIEDALKAHPHIRDCCAVGVELPAAGTAIEAFVVWNEEGEAPIPALRAWLGGRLARYKIPRGIRAVPEIPISPAGKVLKGQLLKECGHELNGRGSVDSQ